MPETTQEMILLANSLIERLEDYRSTTASEMELKAVKILISMVAKQMYEEKTQAAAVMDKLHKDLPGS